MSKKLYFLITFVLVLTLSGAVQAEPCDVNLIGWWKFDEGDGNTVMDSSAYNNNGVTVSPTPSWVGGYPGDPCDSAMDFDGLSDYVLCAERVGNNPGTYPAELMPDTFTVSCWTKLDSFTFYGGFVGNGMDGECGFFLQNGGNANNFGLSMMSETGGWWDVETPTPRMYDTDRWYHLAATYDGQYVTVYVDGEIAEGPTNVGGPIRWNNDINDYPDNFTIGSWENWGESYPVDGIIDEVRFYNYVVSPNDIKFLAGIVPGAATNPNPRYGARDVSMYTDLSWTPGTDSNSHDVYFGTLESEVTDANIDVNFGVYMGRQDANVFSNSNLVPALELDKTYYWRIDEVNDPCLIKGRVWSFTVANYIFVDDMDSYADTTALRAVWIVTHLTNNGAELFVEKEPDFVRDGNSMMFTYRNRLIQNQLRGSEAEASTANFEVGTDWTTNGVEALVLYFQGDAGNGTDHDSGYVYPITEDQMYVAVVDGDSNVGVVKYDKEHDYDMNDIKKTSWQEWNIDLEDPCLIAVDMNNVAKVYIGFGGLKTGQTVAGAGKKSGGFDTVWFDDIRLYPPRCMPEKVATDITGDCTTDYLDLDIMAADWLASDANITAVEPCDVNLIGWWKFDEGDGNTVADSSAYNNNGATVSPTPSWVGGHPNDPCDSAMYFDGLSDYYNVVCAERVGSGPGTYPAELMPDTFTIALWVNLYEFVDYAAFIDNGIDYECGFYLYSGENVGDFGLSMRTESAWMDVIPPNIYDTMTWYHLAVSYDGRYVNFYVDGVLIEGPADVGGPIRWIDEVTGNFPDHFVIGSWEDAGYSQQVHGIIDEVRFYNYALQQGEIAVLAGMYGTIYVPLDVPANLVPKDPCDSEDPNLGTGAFDPNNLDIINFLDYAIMAEYWLEGPFLWPPQP